MNNNNIARVAGFAALLLVSTAALAQVAPNLGTATSFAALGTNASATVGTFTCTGPGTINGNVGSTFTSITNSGPPCTINGTITAPVAGVVVSDFNAAYASINDTSNPCTGTIPTGTAVVTLTPGVYCSTAGTTLGAGTIITLLGSATDVWVFRVGTGGLGALTFTDAQVVMGGAALACNVYWKTAQATTSTRTALVGTVLSGAAVTMTDGSWLGRALATTDVTLTRPTPLTFTGCASATTPGFARQVPTLSEWAMILLATLLALSGFVAMRKRGR